MKYLISNQRNKKRGISLVILAITIVVMTLLAGATIVTTSAILTNAKKTAFSQDLSEIEDAVKSYKLQNDELPIKERNRIHRKPIACYCRYKFFAS